MSVKAIRGAITVENDDSEEIRQASIRLVLEIFKKNDIKSEQVISIVFSVTSDITKYNPATAIRLNGIKDIPLMCFQEANIEGSLDHTIRVIVYLERERDLQLKHVYLNRASRLRPDLDGKE